MYHSRVILPMMGILLLTGVSAAMADETHYKLPINAHLAENGIDWGVTYTAEGISVMDGGVDQDETFVSNLDLTLSLDTAGAGLWNGGKFFVYFLQNHDAGKPSDLIGDMQGTSNIQATRTFRLYELWYEHAFADGHSVLAGLHDFNSEFAVSEPGGHFLHGSFGIAPTVSSSGRASVFPVTALGSRYKGRINDRLSFLAGVYDGDPGSAEGNHHGTDIHLSSEDGAFTAFELIVEPQGADSGTAYKAGLWYNSGTFDDLLDTDGNGDPLRHDGNHGFYGIIDQQLIAADGHALNGFVQLGTANDSISEIEFYAGGGLTYSGIPARPEDRAGIAVAHAVLSEELYDAGGRDKAETAIESSYHMVLSEHVAVHPALQYIINPGADPAVDDAWVGIIRCEITL